MFIASRPLLDVNLPLSAPDMISIGSVLKGHELAGSPIDRAIVAAAKAAKELRGDFEFGRMPAVNVVFHVPGNLGRPDWDGLRGAKFSKQSHLFMVQVAVPREIVDAQSCAAYVVESLFGANALAFEFFRRKKIAFPLADAERLVVGIESSLKCITGHP